MVPYLLDKLKNTPDGDGNLLDNSLIIYGSPMGDSNLHNHKRVPLFVVGHAGGKLKGGLHVKARRRHADGECDAADAAYAGLGRPSRVRRQQRRTGSQRCDDTGRARRGLVMKQRTLVSVAAIGGFCVSALVQAAPARTALVDAAKHGNKDAVRRLLKDGADVNTGFGDGMTALHWAAQAGDVELATLLLRAGANVMATTRVGGYTPLLIASISGDASTINALLTARADPNRATTNGTTPLMLAAASGSADAVKLLIDYGANVDAKEYAKGETALIFAAAYGRAAVIRVLAAHAADTSVTTKVMDLTAFAKEEQERTAARRAGKGGTGQTGSDASGINAVGVRRFQA